MFIFSNLAMTLDGKIGPAHGEFKTLGTKIDWKRVILLREQSNAVLIGASTLREHKKALTSSKIQKNHYNVVLSSNLEGISPDWDFFKSKKIKRILFITEKISNEKISMFSQSSQIFLLKKKKDIVSQIIKVLKDFGVKKLLVEGGGSVMWHFANQNIIDEYYVTLVPRILGGKKAPTLVDGTGFSIQQLVNLKLVKTEIIKDEIFLKYKRRSKRGL